MEPLPSLTGFTLLVPSLGLGNVCQLALDALVNSLLHDDSSSISHAATLHSPYVSPVAGARPFDAPPRGGGDDVCTALEVYTLPAARLAILQQRAPALEGFHELWAGSLARWAAASGITRVLIVGALDAALKGDRELSTELGGQSHVVYIATAPDAAAAALWQPWCGADGSAAAMARLPNSVDIEHRSEVAMPADWAPIAPAAASATRCLLADALGAGYTPVYFRRFLSDGMGSVTAAEHAPAFTAVMLFASEGDNAPDALALAKALACYAGLAELAKGGIRAPRYWAQLNGPRPEQALYG